MMAGNNYPWRDVFAVEDWQEILRRTDRRAIGPGDSHHHLDHITSALEEYHAVPKDFSERFPHRVRDLRFIAGFCERFLKALGPEVQPKVGHKQMAGVVDPWVESLWRRAGKKAEYLETIRHWAATAKEHHKDPVALLDDLNRRFESNVRGAHRELLSTTPYARMEKIDPYHRNIVFFPSDDGEGVDPWKNNPMAQAFDLWLRTHANPAPGRNANASFFEWLEYHPMCTSTPGVSAGYRAEYKKEIHKVDYQPAITGVRRTDGGLRHFTDSGDELLQTSRFPRSGKGPPNACAFVWDQGGNLWVHEHGGAFRHTSFRAGSKVRCAGMIVVFGGLVTHASDESGHYATPWQNLGFFLQWLDAKGCLAATGSAEVHGHGKMPFAHVTDQLPAGANPFP